MISKKLTVYFPLFEEFNAIVDFWVTHEVDKRRVQHDIGDNYKSHYGLGHFLQKGIITYVHANCQVATSLIEQTMENAKSVHRRLARISLSPIYRLVFRT